MRSELRRHSLLPALLVVPLLLVAAIYYRLPLLLNAAILNSDSAVVGLQGRHILSGEWTPFLWGAGYQASFEPTIAAFLFSFLGPTPAALMWTPLSGFLVLLVFAFLTLCRRIGWLRAGFLCLLLALCSPLINGNTVNPPRQWCLTFVFFSIFLLDGVSETSRTRARFFWGAFLLFFAAYLDFFALIFFPGIFYLAMKTSSAHTELDPFVRRERRIALLSGAILGVIFLFAIRLMSSGAGGTASFSLKVLARNWSLFWDTCLPILLGSKVFVAGQNLYPDLWNGPTWFRVLQVIGAAGFCLGIVLSSVAVFSSKVTFEVRRVGILGLIVTVCTVMGFLGSKMVSDMHSARYLGPILWVAPFAFAPLFTRWRLSPALLITPFLVLTVCITWLGYGDFVQGAKPVRTARGQGTDEMELMKLLRDRGITAAVAQYWMAYRLTYLFGENPVVTPQDLGVVRYRPYQRNLENAPIVAHLFHPKEPRYKVEDAEATFQASDIPYQRLDVAGYTVLIAYLKGSSLSE